MALEAPATKAREEEGEEKRTRRLLLILLALLGAAALFLLFLLIWLLRPKPAPPPPGRAGYPIRVVRAIYGFGTGPGQLLRNPLGVAFDPDGNVWISDTGNSRVLVFTREGKFLRAVGTEEPGRLSSPYGIAVDPASRRVYVADWTARAVFVFSTSGRYLERLPAPDQDPAVFGPLGFSPFDVQVMGEKVVTSSNDGLYFFDRTGHVVARWGGGKGRGKALGEFNFPDAIAVDSKGGRIYVTDTLNRRVLALDSSGKVLWVAGKPDEAGKIVGFFQLPRAVLLGPDGKLYVVDTFRFHREGIGVGHIVVLSPEGELLSEFGRAGTEEDSFSFPEKMAAGPGGLFALADRENHRVLLFRLVEPYPTPQPTEAENYSRSFQRP